jgi:hypothetical protein
MIVSIILSTFVFRYHDYGRLQFHLRSILYYIITVKNSIPLLMHITTILKLTKVFDI